MFERLNEYGLRINVSKFVMETREIEFLGYLITPHGSGLLLEKAQAILNYQLSTTNHELRTLLGMINSYRRCLRNASNQSLLHDYLKRARKKDFWTDKEEKTVPTVQR